jgi:hypothetical protein
VRELGLANALVGLHLVSSRTGYGIEALLDDLRKQKKDRDVYVIGAGHPCRRGVGRSWPRGQAAQMSASRPC